MTYEQFCDRLWAYTREKGLGYSEQQLRDTPYPYAEAQLRMKSGLCTMEEVEQSFASACRRHLMRGRQIAEVR